MVAAAADRLTFAFEHDPFESIRTVRRAVVGPYVVIVRPRGDRFVAQFTKANCPPLGTPQGLEPGQRGIIPG